MKALTVRPFEEEDIPHLQKWLVSEDVFKNLYVLYHSMCRDELTSWYKNEKKSGAHIFLYYSNDKCSDVAGIGLIHYIHTKNRCGEISVIVNPKFSGKRYGTYILKHLMHTAFDILNLHKIFLHTAEFNKKMISMIDRMKLIREATYRKELYWEGSYHDIFRYGMLVEEYYS